MEARNTQMALDASHFPDWGHMSAVAVQVGWLHQRNSCPTPATGGSWFHTHGRHVLAAQL
jgi:hypothetical protein